VESISGLIEVRPEPGDSRADVAAYERSLRKRAVEYAREMVAEAGHGHRGHVSSSAGKRRVGGDWRKYRRDRRDPYRKFVCFRVYHSEGEWGDIEWVADADTLSEARNYAYRKAPGIPRSLWDTLRAARDPDAPPKDFQYEDREPLEWIGDNYWIVRVFTTP
jgi:hypothetical protein